MFLWKVGTFEISNDCESDMQQSEIVVLTLLLPMGTRRCKIVYKGETFCLPAHLYVPVNQGFARMVDAPVVPTTQS
jgi:hypothetical protein